MSLIHIHYYSLRDDKNYGNYILVAATYSIAGIKSEIKKCDKTEGRKCRIANGLVMAEDDAEAQKHFKHAQNGYGSKEIPYCTSFFRLLNLYDN